MFTYSDADNGYCNNDDCDDYDYLAVAAHTYSYLRADTQPTLSSECSIACSSYRHDYKSKDQTPNLYTRHTPSRPPRTTSYIDSRPSLKRTRDNDGSTAYANTSVPRVRIDKPMRSSDESVLNRSSMLRIVDYNHPSDEKSSSPRGQFNAHVKYV